jgi:acetyl esterase/lipase
MVLELVCSRWPRACRGDSIAVRAAGEQLTGSPPALIITTECDVMRDEAEAYARQLAFAEVSRSCYKVLGNDSPFHIAQRLTDTLSARAAIRQSERNVTPAFGQPRYREQIRKYRNLCFLNRRI